MAAKKGKAAPRSRAARRAASPSINTDKSLKNVPLPATSSGPRPSVLALQTPAGISKSSTKRKSDKKSAKSKTRAAAMQEKAERVASRTEMKIEKSKGKGRRVQTRRGEWEQLNKAAEVEVEKMNKADREALEKRKAAFRKGMEGVEVEGSDSDEEIDGHADILAGFSLGGGEDEKEESEEEL